MVNVCGAHSTYKTTYFDKIRLSYENRWPQCGTNSNEPLPIMSNEVEHYRGLGTDLDKLYQSIKQVIVDEKNLRIVSEYKGTLNDIPLRCIVAVNTSPKVLVGQLSEIHVSITGNSNDYAVEVASNAWFGSLAWPVL